MITDQTNLCEVFPESLAANLARGNCNTMGDLRKIGHREILLFRNCGWGTIRQIQGRLSNLGIAWPDYAIPFPNPPGQGSNRTTGRYADGFVYLAQTATHSLTKIGFSSVPEIRESTLQGEDPFLHLACAIRSSSSFEAWLHTRFASKRVRGEWFALSRSEIEWIATGEAITEFSNQ